MMWTDGIEYNIISNNDKEFYYKQKKNNQSITLVYYSIESTNLFDDNQPHLQHLILEYNQMNLHYIMQLFPFQDY